MELRYGFIRRTLALGNIDGDANAVLLAIALRLPLDMMTSLTWGCVDIDRLSVRLADATGANTVRDLTADAVRFLQKQLNETGSTWESVEPEALVFQAVPNADAVRSLLEANAMIENIAVAAAFADEPVTITQSRRTRLCADPWHYMEITSRGQFKPCCKINGLPPGLYGDPDTRTSPFLRALRNDLLRGHLNLACEQCHIRPTVRVARQRKLVERAMQTHGIKDTDQPWPLREVRVDVNEACNLRCTYCPVSGPKYAGIPMDQATLEQATSLVEKLPKDVVIHCNGHGETTFHDQWVPFCINLSRQGRRLTLITNLAKSFTSEEIDLLSNFWHLEVSLDSNNDKLMREIRKPIRVHKVFETILRIREASARNGRELPTIGFSVGLYDPSIWTLPDFVSELIKYKVQSVTFWNLIKYPHDKKTKPLSELGADDFSKAQKAVAEARAIMDEHGLRYHFAGDFRGPHNENLLVAR